VTPPRIFTSVDALRGAHGDGSFSTPRQTADLVASVEHHMARADAAEAAAHQLTMERDGARLSLDAAHEARIKQSLELAEARAQLDAAHAHIAVLERVAFTACGHADDLGEKLSEREEQIAARDEADAKVLRVEADWYRARRSVADLRGFVATMRAYHGVELIGVDVSAAVALLDAVEDAARVHFAGGAR